MHHGEAFSAHQLLALLAEDRSTNALALVALGDDVDLRRGVPPPVAVHVALPEALDTIVVEAIVARKRSGVVLALLTPLLWLYDFAVRHIHQHGLVLEAVAFAVHRLEALETEVVFAVRAEDLRLLHGARGAEAAASRGEEGVVLARAEGNLVEGIGACSAEGHQALITLHDRLHHPARLARYLQIAKLLVKQHVRLLEEQAVDGRLRPQAEQVEALPL
mmetsp:Transcript_123672/g.385087  ORF Transcript_123672/g.385087 Transcript_123672/m.385087 type:complete len:219 (+) Transcript_123672:993-1649(+)